MAKGSRKNIYATEEQWATLKQVCGDNLSRWLIGLGMDEADRLKQAGQCVGSRKTKTPRPAKAESTHTVALAEVAPVDASPSPTVEPTQLAEVCVVAANDTAHDADPFAVDPDHLLAVHSSKGA